MIWWLLGVAAVMVVMGGVMAFHHVKPTDNEDEKLGRRIDAVESVGFGIYLVGCILAGLSWALGASSFWTGVGKFVAVFVGAVLASIIVMSE